jgi:hypothetical protein
MSFRMLWAACCAAIAIGSGLTGATSAHAEFGIKDFGGEVVDSSGNPFTQAGGHPYEASTTIKFNTAFDGSNVNDVVEGDAKDIVVDLPPGFLGNPTAVPACPPELLMDTDDPSTFGGFWATCPHATQVGVVELHDGAGLVGNPQAISIRPVYNVEPADDEPFRFGFNFTKTVVTGSAEVRTGGDYGATVRFDDSPAALGIREISLTLWGVPADPSHDASRGANCSALGDCITPGGHSSSLPPRPFLTNPMDCSAGLLTTSLSVNAWHDPATFHTASFDHDFNGNPMEVENCEALRFEPEIRLQPTNPRPDSPTGLDVELSVPQDDSVGGLASAHLKRAEVTLPEGMTVSAAAADGLGACSSAQIGIDDASEPSCPASSRIGTLEIDTPLLDEPLDGEVYLARQKDNPFGSLLAMYIVARGPGVLVKLPGRVDADPVTGRLTTTFDDNPQLPFSSFRLSFKGGPRAPLTTPPTCGTKTVETELSAWSGQTASPSDSFTIACPGTAGGFDPGFAAGSVSPVGGAFSPFVARITRDGGKELGRIDVTVPKGLVAKLRGVPLCTDAQIAAAAGRSGVVTQAQPACPLGSQIGTTTVGAGSGPDPFYPRLPGSDVSGRVFLTEAYTQTAFELAGVPEPAYGLAIEVPAVAGPFDLGTVIVRAAVYVDPVTAQLTVLSDRMPRILQGIPLNVRDVRVDIDRENFAINPTSCDEQQIAATIHAQDGATVKRTSRFQVGDCSALAFRPRLAMRLTGKRQRRTGGHPGLRVRLRQAGGQANLDKLTVELPKTLALDPANAQGLCSYQEGLKPNPKCPASSVIGHATAYTPLLNKPLRGPVYFVENKRRNRFGRLISTLPSLVIALRGEVAINVRQESAVRNGRLVSTTPTIPDAPVSRFDLQLKGGNGGILTVTRTARRRFDICRGRQIANVLSDAQNGRRADYRVRVKPPCTAKAAKRTRDAKPRRGR